MSGSWAVRLTFAAPAGEQAWPDEIEGGFTTREDAVLHGWFAGMSLRAFNLAGVAVGRIGEGTWEPLAVAAASKLALTQIPDSDVYRPCAGDRVMDVRAASWGRAGVVEVLWDGGGVPMVLVRPDPWDEQGPEMFGCPRADVVRLTVPAPPDST